MYGVLLGFVIFFVALFLILIVIGIFFWFSSSDSETTICTTEQLNTPEENWAAYQAVPTGTNPFYLKSESQEGPFELFMTNSAAVGETCTICGDTYIPFPKYCQIDSKRMGEEYVQDAGQTDTEMRKYSSEMSTITLGPDCLPPLGSGLQGIPITKWS